MSAKVGAMTTEAVVVKSHAACSARSAGKVFAGDENPRTFVARSFNTNEGSGSPAAVRRQSKNKKSPYRALNALQELLGNDLVLSTLRDRRSDEKI